MAQIDLGPVIGPQGPKGDPGEIGPQGPQGPQGPAGEFDMDAGLAFTEASTRANINSNESLKTILGKIKKYFTDLKTHAFNTPANNLTTTQEGYALDARQGKALDDKVTQLNSALTDFRSAEALHAETIAEAKSYTLDKSISDYKLIEVIMQYGSTNWVTTRYFRPGLLTQFPQIYDSAQTSMFECSYNAYLSGKTLNVSAITSNARLLIRGIK